MKVVGCAASGAIPTLWANALASKYAPKLKLVGAASGGNAPDLIQNLAPVNGTALAAKDAIEADGCSGSVVNAPFETVGQFSNYPTSQALEAAPRVQQVFAKINLIGGPVPERRASR